LCSGVTHEGFAASWPAMEEATGEFGKKMNSMPKFVASRTLWGKETRFGLATVDLLRRRGGAEDRGTSRVIRCVAGVGVARDRRWLWTPRLRSRLW